MTPWDHDHDLQKHSISIHFQIFFTTVIHFYILLLVFPTVVGILLISPWPRTWTPPPPPPLPVSQIELLTYSSYKKWTVIYIIFLNISQIFCPLVCVDRVASRFCISDNPSFGQILFSYSCLLFSLVISSLNLWSVIYIYKCLEEMHFCHFKCPNMLFNQCTTFGFIIHYRYEYCSPEFK